MLADTLLSLTPQVMHACTAMHGAPSLQCFTSSVFSFTSISPRVDLLSTLASSTQKWALGVGSARISNSPATAAPDRDPRVSSAAAPAVATFWARMDSGDACERAMIPMMMGSDQTRTATTTHGTE